MEEGKKFLNETQLRQLDGSYHKEQMLISKNKYAKLQRSKSEVELTLISAQYTLKKKELEEQNKLLRELEEELKELKRGHKELIGQISKSLDISSNWGFDPETGEIHE